MKHWISAAGQRARKTLILCLDLTGLPAVLLKFFPRLESPWLREEPSTGLLWIAGVYVALFGLASHLYQNELDLIENKVAPVDSLGSSAPKTSVVGIHELKTIQCEVATE